MADWGTISIASADTFMLVCCLLGVLIFAREGKQAPGLMYEISRALSLFHNGATINLLGKY